MKPFKIAFDQGYTVASDFTTHPQPDYILHMATYVTPEASSRDDLRNRRQGHRSDGVTPVQDPATSLEVSTLKAARSEHVILLVLMTELAKRNNNLGYSFQNERQTVRQLRSRVANRERTIQALKNVQETEAEKFDLDDAARVELQVTVEALKTDIDDLTTGNQELSRSRDKLSKSRRKLVEANKKLAEDLKGKEKTIGTLTGLSDELLSTQKDLFVHIDQLAQTKDQLDQTNSQLSRSNERLSTENEQLAKINVELSKSKEELSDDYDLEVQISNSLTRSNQDLVGKHYQLFKTNEELSAFSQRLSNENRNIVQARDKWRQSYQKLSNWVAEAKADASDSRQKTIASIKTTEECLAKYLRALAPGSQLSPPPDSVKEDMKRIFSGIDALGRAFSNAEKAAKSKAELPAKSAGDQTRASPSIVISSPIPSQQIATSFDLRRFVIIWAVRYYLATESPPYDLRVHQGQNYEPRARFRFRLDTLITFLVVDDQDYRSLIYTSPYLFIMLIVTSVDENDGNGRDGNGNDGNGHDGNGHDGNGHDGNGHEDDAGKIPSSLPATEPARDQNASSLPAAEPAHDQNDSTGGGDHEDGDADEKDAGKIPPSLPTTEPAGNQDAGMNVDLPPEQVPDQGDDMDGVEAEEPSNQGVNVPSEPQKPDQGDEMDGIEAGAPSDQDVDVPSQPQ